MSGVGVGEADEIGASGYRARLYEDARSGAVVSADDWMGAVFGLGFRAATDRAGQMDVLRRRARGTLAQVVGKEALADDIRQRRLGLDEVARRCLDLLPSEQAAFLEAFACGANTALRRNGSAMTWAALDSVAVAQVLFQSLGSDGAELRMTEVMRRSLPAPVVDFLLDGADDWATDLDGSPGTVAHAPLPLEELRDLVGKRPAEEGGGGPVVADTRPLGSNAWAVAGAGGTVLANDMHLHLTDPALLYPVRLVAGGRSACGVTVPGLPVLIAGTNGDVAWGLTRLYGDNVDLTPVTPSELAAAETVREVIEVRGEQPVEVDVLRTPWGPVADSVAGEPVAFTSTLLDPGALDFALTELYEARDVETALAVFNDSGLPPVNAIVADAARRVGWTVGGRFPRRSGAPGPRGLSSPGARPPAEWLAPGELPRVRSTASGTVVNCNNASHIVRDAGLAWNLPCGTRSRRVARELAAGRTSAADARALQLDVEASFYEFYRALALRHLPAAPKGALLREVREDIEAWTGTAAPTERGLALLTALHDLLREALFAAVTWPARTVDERFTYCYAGNEVPLRRLIGALSQGLVPAPWRSETEFVVGQLLVGRKLLMRTTGLDRLPRWGEANRLRLSPAAAHPAAAVDVALAGCADTVCVAWPDFGAAMRLVVDLGDPAGSSLSLPGGPREGVAMADHVRSWAAGRSQRLWPAGLPDATRTSDGE
ncbi:penicillin amidase [Streptomyces sp. yr375]|uniref:penicillin acylase family protein n=1 Tax=Streptomyces sp. yr375 TaxID=1761906 RepID=UPI0008C9C444|nr:penicillin acylase family protein [Streptomyces sp. yr375]SES03358.1 penicillin amidase [Streptomyces sp. yr375]